MDIVNGPMSVAAKLASMAPSVTNAFPFLDVRMDTATSPSSAFAKMAGMVSSAQNVSEGIATM